MKYFLTNYFAAAATEGGRELRERARQYAAALRLLLGLHRHRRGADRRGCAGHHPEQVPGDAPRQVRRQGGREAGGAGQPGGPGHAGEGLANGNTASGHVTQCSSLIGQVREYKDQSWLGLKTRSRDATLSRHKGININELYLHTKIATT